MPEFSYFRISRSIYNSAIWHSRPELIKLFIYLLGQARYGQEPKKYPGFEVKRGEVLTSLSQIADDNEWFYNRVNHKWPRQTIARMLCDLEELGVIKKISDTFGTHINIVNYNTYQSSDIYNSDNDETTVRQPRDNRGHNLGTTEEGNKDKKGKKDERKRKTLDPTLFLFPESLSTPEVERELNAWISYKTSIGDSYKTEESINRLLTQWAVRGPFSFTSAVNNSIANGYKGLFEPKVKEPSNGTESVHDKNINAVSTIMGECGYEIRSDGFNIRKV